MVDSIPSEKVGPRLATAEQWDEEVRLTFRKLYIEEDKPLQQVMVEMVDLLGFHATERQYKRKITAWQLDKNVKDEEMRHIIRVQKKRKLDHDKDSVFYVRERLVDPKNIARFASRKKLKEDENSLTSNLPSEPLPTHIRCCTPDDEGLHGNPFTELDLHHEKTKQGHEEAVRGPVQSHTISDPYQILGLDHGFPDLDTPENDDLSAIQSRSGDDQDASQNVSYRGKGPDYYAVPFNISIPRYLDPLPDNLKQNPMNLLYFNHFLIHTATTLVAYDCEDNPFKTVLPMMAIKDNDLLYLLLTYSAQHRACLLDHLEPPTRASWVRPALRALREALASLSSNRSTISSSTVATALMLTSQSIIFPTASGSKLYWQDQLDIARSLIITYTGAPSFDPGEFVNHFLIRWFARLDVFGCLSDPKYRKALRVGPYWPAVSSEENFQVDSMLGFTQRYVTVLARLSRVNEDKEDEYLEDGFLGLQNSPLDLLPFNPLDLEETRVHRFHDCLTGNENGFAILEVDSLSTAFYWAGHIYAGRSSLATDRLSEFGVLIAEEKIAVQEILSSADKIRSGHPAEGHLLFPLFFAGCVAPDAKCFDIVMKRLKTMESHGLSHIHEARQLLESIWREAHTDNADISIAGDRWKAWKRRSNGEFLGVP